MNVELFTSLAQQIRPMLKSIGNVFFPHSDESDDVVQETFMRLWLMRDQLVQGESIVPLARRIAKNVCVSIWRRNQLRIAVSLDESMPVATGNRPDNTLTEMENSQILQEAIEHLTPSEKRLFLLRQDPELDIQAIASITGMNVRSVSAKLSSARKKVYEYIIKVQ